jgi:hypothetical protein
VGDIGMHRMLCPVPPDCRGSLRLRVVGRGTVGIRVSAIRIVS